MDPNVQLLSAIIDELKRRLAAIAEIIEVTDQRAMAADGPVTKTRHEMTDEDFRRIYKLAKGVRPGRKKRTAAGLRLP